MGDLVAIRAKFERFPAAVKGALLLRGPDHLGVTVHDEIAFQQVPARGHIHR